MSSKSRNVVRRGWLMAGSACLISSLALAQSPRHLTLPPPYATPSAMKFPKVIGWPADRTPTVPSGFTVDVLAGDLESPRWLYVLANNDVLVSQGKTEKTPKADPTIEQG